ncbi:MAG: hypothetical protein ABL908_02820 [Hyphomicrobium sp.]
MTRDKEAVTAWHPVALRELEPGYNRASVVYEHYCEWCEGRGLEPLALPTFFRQLLRDGISDAEKIEGRVYHRLRPAVMPTAPTAA